MLVRGMHLEFWRLLCYVASIIEEFRVEISYSGFGRVLDIILRILVLLPWSLLARITATVFFCRGLILFKNPWFCLKHISNYISVFHSLKVFSARRLSNIRIIVHVIVEQRKSIVSISTDKVSHFTMHCLQM